MLDIIFHQPPVDGLVAIGPVDALRYLPVAQALQYQTDLTQSIYYSPTLLLKSSHAKEYIYGTRVLWADVDRKHWECVLPPSLVVSTGGGYHLYWLLDTWLTDHELIESLNKTLADDVDGDHCWNVNRLLRLPGSLNYKYTPPAPCAIERATDCVYGASDITALGKLTRKTKHKIRTGDSRGYPSRSERDWSVVSELILFYADSRIESIFKHNRIGDRLSERGGDYLSRTISKARATTPSSRPVPATGLDKQDDGYYAAVGKTVRRLSTFTLELRAVLKSPQGDGVLCDIVAGGARTENVVIKREAFNSRQALDKILSRVEWTWLGKDDDLRLLLPYLLRNGDVPELPASSVTGLVASSFVTPKGTLGGPTVYLPTGRETPQIRLVQTGDKPDMRELPTINAPEIIWPVLGWFHAAPVKTWFEQLGYRFPCLNIYGIKGSGKTTTIHLMQRLMGYETPKTYDANTTTFVILSLLASTNAYPISFSEYRQAHISGLLRYILLAYDTGSAPRGKSDQSTVDYSLSAPFSVDGEDPLTDPAIRERVLAVEFFRETLNHEAYDHFSTSIATSNWGYYYYDFLLRKGLEGIRGCLDTSSKLIRDVLPKGVPYRVSRNFSVAWSGIRLFAEAAGAELPDAKLLLRCLANLSYHGGRLGILADEFIEDLVNGIKSSGYQLPLIVDTSNSFELWFQYTPAYGWWTSRRRRSGLQVLSKDAIRSQVQQLPYVKGEKELKGVWMIGIDLVQAKAAGLDIPDNLTKPINASNKTVSL